ncbi:MAG: phosphate signaling complex protein PhoU [candidate division WOR-3 bacterium]
MTQDLTSKEQALENLKKLITEMAISVREMVALAIDGLREKDRFALERVREIEKEVNAQEVAIDNEAVKFMALFQPSAGDLRAAMMILRMNSNLERMGDHAYNIAREAEFLISHPQIKPLLDIPRMADIVMGMMDDTMTALRENNPEIARAVCRKDDEVDALRDQVIRELIIYMMSDPETIERAMKLIQVAQNLERLGDLATNLGEDIVYMTTGRVIKHHIEEEEREKGKTP